MNKLNSYKKTIDFPPQNIPFTKYKWCIMEIDIVENSGEKI